MVGKGRGGSFWSVPGTRFCLLLVHLNRSSCLVSHPTTIRLHSYDSVE